MDESIELTPGVRAAAERLGIDLRGAPMAVPRAAHIDLRKEAADLGVRLPTNLTVPSEDLGTAMHELRRGGVLDWFKWRPRLPWAALYDRLTPGTFKNLPLLMWTGPDQFRFIQPKEPEQQFCYIRNDNVTVIRPLIMDTDGGSIPRIVRPLEGYSPWGYAPAFLIHDWLYVAHKCDCAPDNQWTFEETALLMAECMKTLIERDWPAIPGKVANGQKYRIAGDRGTVYAMYEAVMSGTARNLFADKSTVTPYTDAELGYEVDFRLRPAPPGPGGTT